MASVVLCQGQSHVIAQSMKLSVLNNMASVVLCQGQSHVIAQSMKLSVLNNMASVVLSERIYYIRIIIAFYDIKGILSQCVGGSKDKTGAITKL